MKHIAWLWPFSYPSLFSCFSNKLLQTVKILNFISLKSTVVKSTWRFYHVSICFQILGYYKQYVLWNFLNYVTNKAVIQGFERGFFFDYHGSCACSRVSHGHIHHILNTFQNKPVYISLYARHHNWCLDHIDNHCPSPNLIAEEQNICSVPTSLKVCSCVWRPHIYGSFFYIWLTSSST